MKLVAVLDNLRENNDALSRLGVKSLAIFGSTAIDQAAKTSDIDILVDFDTAPRFDQFIETRFYLDDLLGCQVDLVTMDGLKPLARLEVEKEAIFVT
jgi:hypothetical protein